MSGAMVESLVFLPLYPTPCPPLAHTPVNGRRGNVAAVIGVAYRRNGGNGVSMPVIVTLWRIGGGIGGEAAAASWLA